LHICFKLPFLKRSSCWVRFRRISLKYWQWFSVPFGILRKSFCQNEGKLGSEVLYALHKFCSSYFKKIVTTFNRYFYYLTKDNFEIYLSENKSITQKYWFKVVKENWETFSKTRRKVRIKPQNIIGRNCFLKLVRLQKNIELLS